MADIPGLIEGASEGRIGHRFLRHVERARVLCLLIDLAPMDEMSAQQQEETLLNELGQYRPDLLDRPRIVVGTKADMASLEDVENFGTPFSDFIDHPLGSARTRWTNGISCSRISLGRTTSRGGRQDGAPIPGLVRLDDNEFRLVGREVERVVALNDVTTPEALDWIDSRLERLGISKMLARAGVADGDIVWIGEFSFEYQADV